MTKKVFSGTAEILFDLKDDMSVMVHESLVEEFVLMFEEENPGFDSDRFRKACGLVAVEKITDVESLIEADEKRAAEVARVREREATADW